MVPKLVQIKVDPALKDKLQRIALSKGITVTGYIKMRLIEASERDDDDAITENGFTTREEKRLARSYAAAKKTPHGKRSKGYKTAEDFFRALNE